MSFYLIRFSFDENLTFNTPHCSMFTSKDEWLDQRRIFRNLCSLADHKTWKNEWKMARWGYVYGLSIASDQFFWNEFESLYCIYLSKVWIDKIYVKWQFLQQSWQSDLVNKCCDKKRAIFSAIFLGLSFYRCLMTKSHTIKDAFTIHMLKL